MSFPAIAQVDAYWEGLRAGRLMPERADIDPRGIDGALEHAFMLELIAPQVARLRIAGGHLHDILGMEVRGMPISAFFEPEARAKLGDVVGRIAATALIAEFKLSAPRSLGQPALNGRMYLAPLGNKEDGVTRILGCLETRGTVGRTPRRFHIDHVKTRRVVDTAGPVSSFIPAPSTRPLPVTTQRDLGKTPADTPKPQVKPTNPMQFSEPMAHFSPAPKSDRGVPYLRLIKTDT